MVQPEVSVVIVAWNGRELLGQCLRSLGRFLTSASEVIVVDNKSTDGTPDMVVRDFPHVQLIRSPKNLGFAGGTNLGAAQARGRVLFLLNPDTELTDASLPPLFSLAQNDATIGAVGPELLNADQTHQPSVRAFPRWPDQAAVLLKLRAVLRRTGFMRRYLADPITPARRPVDVDQIMGAAMIIPKKVWDAVGEFDGGYPNWFEEVDWCRRAKNAGYRIIYNPQGRLIHHGGTSFRQVMSVKKHVWYLRGMWRYAGKYWPPLVAWSLLPLIVLSYILTVVLSIIKPR